MEETNVPAWAEKLVAAHLSVCDAVSHTLRLKSNRYFVWHEDGANDEAADDRHGERAVTGATDLYSVREFDPWADEWGDAMDEAGISWNLVSVAYEDQTGLYHWSWDWEVL